MLLHADARQIPLADESVQTVVTSPPYWGLRDYGIAPSIWGGREDCVHEWGDTILNNATNHTDKRRWNHTRNGRDELQPIEKRVAWLRTEVPQGKFCQICGAWAGVLGLEPNPTLYVQHIVEIFREVRRVLRKDGVAWINLGDSYAGSWGAQGGPSNLGLPPSGVYADKSPTRNTRLIGLKPKDLVGIPWRVAFALQADGWWLRSDIIWHKPNPMPGSQRDRCTTAHEYIFMLAKSGDNALLWRNDRTKTWVDKKPKPHWARVKPLPIQANESKEYGGRVDGGTRYNHLGFIPGNSRKFKWKNLWHGYHYYFEMDAIREPHAESTLRMAQYPDTWRSENKRNGEARSSALKDPISNPEGRNKRSVWTVATQPYPEAHFATFPEDLIKPCILAGAPVGGIVLDPFAGSGTTVKVAQDLGRVGIGLDLKPDYLRMALSRSAQRGLGL